MVFTGVQVPGLVAHELIVKEIFHLPPRRLKEKKNQNRRKLTRARYSPVELDGFLIASIFNASTSHPPQRKQHAVVDAMAGVENDEVLDRELTGLESEKKQFSKDRENELRRADEYFKKLKMEIHAKYDTRFEDIR